MIGLAVFCFLVVFGLMLFAIVFGAKYMETQRRKQVSEMLRTVEGAPVIVEPSVLKTESSGRQVTEYLDSDMIRELEKYVHQSSLGWPVGKLLGMTVVAALVGVLVSLKARVLIDPWLSTFALAVAFGALPFLYVKRQRAKRFKEFEQQLPDALDFLGRSVRAGHALSISLEMVADESPEPLRTEFRTFCNEQNLGAPMDVALQHLAERVPIIDVRFLVSTLLLQRQTGGNLAEILDKLAYVIRERFRLRGQVKAASAHGRLTGLILTLLPILVCVGLMLISPDYLKTLSTDSTGRILIVCAVIGQFLGYMFIRKIVNIKI